MKIVFFIPRMSGGGAERVVANLANEFDKRGNSVLIYTPTDQNSFYQLRSSVRIVGENYSVSKKKVLRQVMLAINGIKLWFAYQKKIRIEKPDVVISFLTETNCIALTHKHKNYKLIVSERNDPTKYSKVIQLITKKLYCKADALVCQSHRVAKFFGFGNTKVIPNPIDTMIIPTSYKGVRKKRVCAVGRLMFQKNFANLIKAFSLLSKEFGEYTLEIYGDGPLRTELHQLIYDLNLSKRVKLMGAHKDVLERIKDSSLFVMSSNYEGYPNALAEAMAIGLPVICTDFDSGTARELVGEKNGCLVPVNDSNALAEAMEYLLCYPEIRDAMSMENQKISDSLAVEKIADQWLGLIY
ncbi:MAG: glycosyltransferase [Ruminococcus sp.]|nr:glycosyltransferase [Ruminococcus sp.]